MKAKAITSGFISPHAMKASIADISFCGLPPDGSNYLASKILPVLIRYPYCENDGDGHITARCLGRTL
jgi:hypothetical protein